MKEQDIYHGQEIQEDTTALEISSTLPEGVHESTEHEQWMGEVDRNIDLTDSYGMYHQLIGKFPSELSYEQQQRAFGLLRDNPDAQAKDLNSEEFKSLARNELNRTLLENAFNDSVTVKDLIQLCNLRLVVSIAKKYQWSGIDIMDLIQEGNEVLGKVVDKFDHTRPIDKDNPDGKNVSFSTYATFWIKQAVGRIVSNHSRTIRVPVYMHEALIKLHKEVAKFQDSYHEVPTDDQLAELLRQNTGLSNSVINSAIRAYNMGSTQRMQYLSQVIPGMEDKGTLMDIVADQSFEVEDQTTNKVAKEAMRLAIDNVLSQFSEEHQRIYRMRSGLDGKEGCTLQEVGNEFGLSRERIRQIEKKITTALKRDPEMQKWQNFYLSESEAAD